MIWAETKGTDIFAKKLLPKFIKVKVSQFFMKNVRVFVWTLYEKYERYIEWFSSKISFQTIQVNFLKPWKCKLLKKSVFICNFFVDSDRIPFITKLSKEILIN